MLGPAHRYIARHRRAAAAALVVIDQLPSVGESVEAREQVVVVRPRSAVQYHRWLPPADPPDEQLDTPDGDEALSRGFRLRHKRPAPRRPCWPGWSRRPPARARTRRPTSAPPGPRGAGTPRTIA